MKILLTDILVEPGPTTLLVFPGRPEGDLKTLAGERVEGGFVGASSWSVVHDPIHQVSNPDGSEEEIHDAEGAMRDEMKWMARTLLAFDVGSPIGVTYDREDNFSLDDSKATVVDLPPDLAEGDRVVVVAPAKEELVNARGRVDSIYTDHALVEVDEGDRGRLERSRVVGRYPGAVLLPRHWLERAEARRWRRVPEREIWRMRRVHVREMGDLP